MADGEVDGFTDLVEQFTVFCFVNGVQIRTNKLHAEALQRTVMGKFAGDVEGRLAAHSGKKCTGAFLLENLANGIGKQRFDVDHVRHFGVVLNRRRIGIHEDDLVAVFSKRTNRLGA